MKVYVWRNIVDDAGGGYGTDSIAVLASSLQAARKHAIRHTSKRFLDSYRVADLTNYAVNKIQNTEPTVYGAGCPIVTEHYE